MKEESKSVRDSPETDSKRIPLMKATSNDDFSLPSPVTPNRQTQLKSAKTFQVDKDSLQRYKRILQKRVAWSFIFIFLVIFQRIFATYFRATENEAIRFLQRVFHVEEGSTNLLLQPLVLLENYQFFVLLLTHYFIVIYYYYNAIVCVKIMFVLFNAMGLVSLVQVVFGDPRPYWEDEKIVGVSCQNSYGFPSLTTFSILFLFMYSWNCFSEDEEEDKEWETKDIVKCGLFIMVFGAYCFLRILTGLEYISHLLLAIMYAVLIYFMAIFFDQFVTNLVEKSTIDVQSAKRYSIFWMIYILSFVGVVTIIYESSDTFLDITWVANHFKCLDVQGKKDVLKDTPYFHLLGAWGSYLKTMVFLALLGAVFGVAKAFRDFKGVLWYETTGRNKALMTAIASICVLPSWLIVSLQGFFILYLQQGGIDEYMLNALHFSFMYFVIFGLLPKAVFDKMSMLNKDQGFFMIGDEEMRGLNP